MALETADIAYDVSNLLGEDYLSGTGQGRASVQVVTNVTNNLVVDTAGNQIRLGAATRKIDASGIGTLSVWVPGAGSNPASWQTSFLFDVPDPSSHSGRRRVTLGPFTITADANLADLVAEMPVQPEYASDVLERLDALEADSGTGDALAELSDRLDGVNDHGNVTGTLTIDPAHGYHVFDATGPTEVTLADPPGNSVSFKAITGADDVTVDGLADLVLTDDQWATFVYYRDAWHLASAGASGGGEVEPVVDPPTQPGTVTVDPTADGYNLTWVASTVAAGYEVQIDGGSWVDSGTDLAHTHTGLSAGSSHSGAVRAYNSIGERSTTRAWGPVSTDTPGLHEQILAFTPALYTRFSQGAIEDFGTLPSSWAPDGGTVPALNGTALTPGATGSAVFTTAKSLKRAVGTELDNAQKLTVIYVADPNGATDDPSNLLFLQGGPRFGFGSSQTYYEFKTQKHLIVQTMERDTGGTITRQQWRDGVSVGITFPSSISATYDVTNVFLNGTSTSPGAGAKTFLLDRVVYIVGTILTQADAIALSQAAGTYGNGSVA